MVLCNFTLLNVFVTAAWSLIMYFYLLLWLSLLCEFNYVFWFCSCDLWVVWSIVLFTGGFPLERLLKVMLRVSELCCDTLPLILESAVHPSPSSASHSLKARGTSWWPAMEMRSTPCLWITGEMEGRGGRHWWEREQREGEKEEDKTEWVLFCTRVEDGVWVTL